MVLVMITFFTLAAVTLHRLQPHWMLFNGCFTVITVRLVSDGLSSFIQNVALASMVMALLCHLSYGIKWLFQQGRQCITYTRSDEEQPLVVSHGLL
jgi:succinate dehydrogenase/fumarate reductase cytochrome b subunit